MADTWGSPTFNEVGGIDDLTRRGISRMVTDSLNAMRRVQIPASPILSPAQQRGAFSPVLPGLEQGAPFADPSQAAGALQDVFPPAAPKLSPAQQRGGFSPVLPRRTVGALSSLPPPAPAIPTTGYDVDASEPMRPAALPPIGRGYGGLSEDPAPQMARPGALPPVPTFADRANETAKRIVAGPSASDMGWGEIGGLFVGDPAAKARLEAKDASTVAKKISATATPDNPGSIGALDTTGYKKGKVLPAERRAVAADRKTVETARSVSAAKRSSEHRNAILRQQEREEAEDGISPIYAQLRKDVFSLQESRRQAKDTFDPDNVGDDIVQGGSGGLSNDDFLMIGLTMMSAASKPGATIMGSLGHAGITALGLKSKRQAKRAEAAFKTAELRQKQFDGQARVLTAIAEARETKRHNVAMERAEWAKAAARRDKQQQDLDIATAKVFEKMIPDDEARIAMTPEDYTKSLDSARATIAEQFPESTFGRSLRSQEARDTYKTQVVRLQHALNLTQEEINLGRIGKLGGAKQQAFDEYVARLDKAAEIYARQMEGIIGEVFGQGVSGSADRRPVARDDRSLLRSRDVE